MGRCYGIYGLRAMLKYEGRLPGSKSVVRHIQNHKMQPANNQRNIQLYSRKILNQDTKFDAFEPKKVKQELPHVNTSAPKPKKAKSHIGTGRKQYKEALAKYFDNDNPKNDYLIDFAEEEQKFLEQNKAYRNVKDAESIRELVEKSRKNSTTVYSANETSHQSKTIFSKISGIFKNIF